jgi:methyltransferase (TIGR00027 family)
MEQNQASSTAQRVALRRAAHQLLDDPKVFSDPLALRIIGKDSASTLRADPGRFETSPLSPYLRAFIAARSRYVEDQLSLGVQNGVSQYVIMGAGLDTFAYRNPYPGDTLRVFEVDHPATQAWKRSRLDEAGIVVPPQLAFVALDFETQSLADQLMEAGYDPAQRTMFSWLGVTPYLRADAVMATLSFIASVAIGSAIVFDYAISPSLMTARQRAVFEKLAERVAADGEPFRAFFEPQKLVSDLGGVGFGHVENSGPEEINAMYFKGRHDGLRVGSLSQIMKAEV